MDLVVATKNPGKIREISDVLAVPGLVFHTFEEFSDWPEIEETGETLEENAVLKAEGLRDRYGFTALADDSGLLVDFLGGRPGVHSSRYAGPEGDSERNIDRLLAEMAGVPAGRRGARFACVIALAPAAGGLRFSKGECEGVILDARRGTGGFGYDPVFMPAGFDRSMAELSLEEKNAISHRGRALREIRSILMGSGRALAF